MVVHRIYILIMLLWDYHKKKHPASNAQLLSIAIRLVINILVAALAIYLFIKSDNMKGQNIYCQVWGFVNCLILVIEPIYVLLQIFFNKKYSALIKIDDLFTCEANN